MLEKGNKVRLKQNVKFKNRNGENVVLLGSDEQPVSLTLVCTSNEKDGHVDVAGFGVIAHLLAERLRPETQDDLD